MFTGDAGSTDPPSSSTPSSSKLGLGRSRPTSIAHTPPSFFDGPRRAKTPMRARKIVAAMESGFAKAEAKVREKADVQRSAELVAAEKGGDSSTRKGKERQLEPAPGETTTVTLTEEEQEFARFLRGDKAVTRPEEGNGGSPFSKQAMPDGKEILLSLRPSASSLSSSTSRKRPRQSCLAILESQDEETPSTDRDDVSSDGAPPVPLFSSSSKRQIQALTSKAGLRDHRNPITHSAVGRGTMHYVSASTGHQVANRVTAAGPAPEGWWATRTRKVRDQLKAEVKDTGQDESSSLFQGCNVYINGYTGSEVGNRDLIRLLGLHGAEVHMLPIGSTTHIVSSMQLNAKKRHEMIHLKAGRVTKFVKVEWVTDSIKAGKRKPEHLYSHGTETQRGIAEMLGGATAKPTSSSTSLAEHRTPFLPSKNNKAAVSTTLTRTPLLQPGDDWRQLAREEAARREGTVIQGCSN